MLSNINKIQTKLQLAFLLVVMLAASIGLVSYLYLQRISAYQSLKNQVDEVLMLTAEMRKYEHNILNNDVKSVAFMRSGRSLNLHLYEQKNQKVQHLFSEILSNSLSKKIQVEAKVKQAQARHQSYNRTVRELISKLLRRGHKSYGLEGKMHQAAREVEKTDSVNQAILLTLRRHEKDFIIRKDWRYVEKFEAQLDSANRFHTDSLSASKAEAIAQALEKYQRYFAKITAIEKVIGLSENTGLRGELSQISSNMEKEMGHIHYLITQRTQYLTQDSTGLIVAFILSMLLLSLILGFYFSYTISQPIILLDRIAKSIVKGLRNQELFLDRISTNDEIGSLARNLKQMIIKLKESLQQAQEQNAHFKTIADSEALRRWHIEGLGVFNEIFRRHKVSLEQQAFEIIAELVKYTRSSQGGLFVVNDNHQEFFLSLKGCYAYDRKKSEQKRIELGEGLVGAVWQSGKMVHLNEIPEGYAYITSGLRRIEAKTLLIVPVKSETEVVGVIELVSLGDYAPYQVSFIEAVADRIGTALLAIKSRERNRELLAETEAVAQESQRREADLQKQLDSYQHWVQQFERKLNTISEEGQIYEAIIGKVFAGYLITDEHFKIIKMNNYINKRFNFRRQDLIEQSVERLLEVDFDQIVNLQEVENRENLVSRRYDSYVHDKSGKSYEISLVAAQLDLHHKTIYLFMFNESEDETATNKLKVAS